MKVPTISLQSCFEAGGLSADASARSAELLAVVDAVRGACEHVGFFVVVDHGVDSQLLQDQHRECSAFFDRPPQSNVLDMLCADSSRFAWLDFVPSAAGQGQGDWALGPMQGRGTLPWRPDSEAFAATWSRYYAAMEGLVGLLMQLFALALELPAGTFEPALQDHRSSMRAILYPEVAEAEFDSRPGDVVRSPEHTDWGCVTVLLADGAVGGLEVCGKDGVWEPVQPVPGGLVVNLGDLLPWWTGGRWVATPHRVVARPDATRQRRVSVPYFGLVGRATVLAPLVAADVSQEDDGKTVKGKQMPVVTAGEFFDRHEEFALRR